ncbi:hypothetical protein D3C87_1909150 [compost metagenome]
MTVKLPYVPVASPVKLSTASWSTSLALTVPAAVKGPSSAVAPLWAADEITGASLVPVTVMVTSWVVVAPLSSVTVTVKVSVKRSLADRLWLLVMV